MWGALEELRGSKQMNENLAGKYEEVNSKFTGNKLCSRVLSERVR